MTLPFVSVVIPMRNEIDWIERCLGTVFAQDYPADRFEILVADGQSDDGSRELLDDLARREPRLRVLENPHRIVPGGLNLAIAAARGEIIARIDAHTEIEPDYLSVGVETLGRTGAENVGGPMICRGGGPVADAIAAAMSSRWGVGAQFHFATDERECDTVYMGMWPRHAFEEIGLFDEELVRNQDDELNYRLRKHGGRIVVSPAMRSLYQNRETWKALLRQFYQYGLWKTRVLQKHPRQMSVRHYIPPTYQLATFVALAVPLLRPLGAASLILYGAAMAAVTLVEANGFGPRVRLWAALIAIHQSWAFGFLVGMVRFAPRWLVPEQPAPRLGEATHLEMEEAR